MKHNISSVVTEKYFNMGKLFAKISYIAIISLVFLLVYIILSTNNSNDKFLQSFTIIFTVLFSLFVLILGIYLNLFHDLSGIGNSFDLIKNDVASRLIKHPEEFSLRVTSLLCDFCNFPFLDIQYSFLHVKNFKVISSSRSEKINIKIKKKNFTPSCSERLKKVNLKISHEEFKEIERKASEVEDVFYYKDITVEDDLYKVYIIPIWFSGEYLGFVGVLTKTKLWKVISLFLSSFEDLYIDDQLIHVLDTHKQIMQKKFYREIDLYSNKITKLEYSTLEQYQLDILSFLVDKIKCKAGLFATIYNKNCVSLFKSKKNESKDIIQYFSDLPVDLKANIFSDANINFKYILSIPILIDKLQGVIYLFDDSNYSFKYFNKTLREIEDIKLDNDLENLANLLRLKPSIDSYISQV